MAEPLGMSHNENRTTRRRVRTSYFTSVISISLVLFMLGLVGMLVLNTRKISDYVKENIVFSVILKDGVKDIEIIRLQKTLDAKAYVKSTNYITKEDAAAKLQKELGEDFIDFLGYNPLLASIDVNLHARYANPDSIAVIRKDFEGYEAVKEVFYQESLVHLINKNVRKISLLILGFSTLLFLIATALINNTIRLAIYARRFTIHTMQLVGATRGFIRRPFLYRSLWHGIFGGLLANIVLALVMYYINSQLREVLIFVDYQLLGIVFGGVIFTGICINWISTFFAVNRYLNIETDKLYY